MCHVPWEPKRNHTLAPCSTLLSSDTVNTLLFSHNIKFFMNSSWRSHFVGLAGTSERLHFLFHSNFSVQKNCGCNVERLELFIKSSVPANEENFSESYWGGCRQTCIFYVVLQLYLILLGGPGRERTCAFLLLYGFILESTPAHKFLHYFPLCLEVSSTFRKRHFTGFCPRIWLFEQIPRY